MEETIRLALELDPDLANFMIAAPFPGTELYDMVQTRAAFPGPAAIRLRHPRRGARYEIGGVTAELVERKWHEAYRRFYLRPGRIWRRALSLDTWRRLPMHLTNFARFFVGK